MRTRSLLGLALIGFLAPSPVQASFHFVSIKEVCGGATASTNAQYVELQMYSSGQNHVNTHALTVYDAGGGLVGTFTFTSDVANGANQATILIATAEAQTYFGVTADLAMTAVLPLGGGAACWDVVDCASWGNFTGNASLPSSAGTPFNSPTGLALDEAIRRRLDIAGSSTVLDPGDDTNDSANDFGAVVPAPRNNAGDIGGPPTPTPTITNTPTATKTRKPTKTATATPTQTPTLTPTATRTKKPKRTPTMTPTASPTATPTATKTRRKPTKTPTVTPTPTM